MCLLDVTIGNSTPCHVTPFPNPSMAMLTTCKEYSRAFLSNVKWKSGAMVMWEKTRPHTKDQRSFLSWAPGWSSIHLTMQLDHMTDVVVSAHHIIVFKSFNNVHNHDGHVYILVEKRMYNLHTDGFYKENTKQQWGKEYIEYNEQMYKRTNLVVVVVVVIVVKYKRAGCIVSESTNVAPCHVAPFESTSIVLLTFSSAQANLLLYI